MVKELLTQSYVSILSIIVGLLAVKIVLHQWDLLGLEILNINNPQPNDYMKREYNLLMLVLFAVVGIGGIGYGIRGLYHTLMIFKNSDDINKK